MHELAETILCEKSKTGHLPRKEKVNIRNKCIIYFKAKKRKFLFKNMLNSKVVTIINLREKERKTISSASETQMIDHLRKSIKYCKVSPLWKLINRISHNYRTGEINLRNECKTLALCALKSNI